VKINGVSFYGTPTRFSPSVFFDTYHWLSVFISRHVSDFSTWVKVGDRRASGILNGQLSTSGYFGFSITLRYRAISTTVFLRFTDFIGDKSPKLSTNGVRRIVDIRRRSVPDSLRRRISLLRGHSSAINGFRLCRHHRISLGRRLDSSASTTSPILPEQRFSFRLQLLVSLFLHSSRFNSREFLGRRRFSPDRTFQDWQRLR